MPTYSPTETKMPPFHPFAELANSVHLHKWFSFYHSTATSIGWGSIETEKAESEGKDKLNRSGRQQGMPNKKIVTPLCWPQRKEPRHRRC